LRTNLPNKRKNWKSAAIPAQVAAGIRNIEALSARRMAQFAAGPGYAGFESTHLLCLDEAIPTLPTIIED
jgi:hypothetical protein